MNSTEIYNKIVEVAERFGANNPQQNRQLPFILSKADSDELFSAIYAIFKLDGFSHFQHQELAGYLLFTLCPKLNFDAPSIIRGVLKSWDKSVEEFPYYFCISYGLKEVNSFIKAIDKDELSDEEKDRLKTFEWWISGYEKVMHHSKFERLQKIRLHYLSGSETAYNEES